MDIDSDQELVLTLDRVERDIAKYQQLLKDCFGFDHFRPSQLKIIQSIIEEKRDNFVIMATAQGKSLCYQFPSLWTGGITIVISPLISLMRDQVASLNKRNIPATFLGSAQPHSYRLREALVTSNKYRLVYMSPGFVVNNKDLLKKLAHKLTLIAIDEVYYGHDFRAEYQQLGELRKMLPNVPIMVTTATATESTRLEIEANLCLNNPKLTCTGFDRPNLELLFEPLYRFHSMIRELARDVDGSIIVFCPSKANCEIIAESLKKDDFMCEFYHAGLENERRLELETQFKSDKFKLIICTCGFGIDKPDVRYVIHYRWVKSIEEYYQQVGHAGRDGKPAKSIVFSNKRDVGKYLSSDTNVLDNSSTFDRQQSVLLEPYFEQYLISDRCRRLNILQYFEGLSVSCSTRLNCCDNCSSGKSSLYSYAYRNMDEKGFFDFTVDSRLLMNVIDSIPNGILRSHINPHQQKSLSHHDASYWDGLLDVLERLMYVQSTYAKISPSSLPKKLEPEIMKLDKLGLKWINSNMPMKCQLQPFDKITRYVEVKSLNVPAKSKPTPVYTPATDMVLLIKENPYPRQAQVRDIKHRHRQVMQLITQRLSVPQIERQLNFSRSNVTGIVATLLQHGYPIKKKDLERLYGIFENVFQLISSKLSRNIFGNDVIRAAKSALPGVSCDQIRLVQCYRYPRIYLKQLGLVFHDTDDIPCAAVQFVPMTVEDIPFEIDSLMRQESETNNDSLEMTQENFNDCNDDAIFGWDDYVASESESSNDSLEMTQENLNDDAILGLDDFIVSRKRTLGQNNSIRPKKMKMSH